MAAELLDLAPDQVMLVAAHSNDLQGAQRAGLFTALVHRPFEWGPQGSEAQPEDPSFNYIAKDFLDLAQQLETA
jgi:2-haloacid dehalogenase